MSTFAMPGNWALYIYHSDHDKGKQGLGYFETTTQAHRIIDLKHTVLTPTHWAEVCDRLDISPNQLINLNHPNASIIDKTANFDKHDWLTVLNKTPELIKGPIFIDGTHALVLNTPSQLEHILMPEQAKNPRSRKE